MRIAHFETKKETFYLYHIAEWNDRLTGWFARHKNNPTSDCINGNLQLWVYAKDNEFEIIGSIHDNPELLTTK